MRKNTHILVSLLLAIGALTAFGANYHEVQVMDEVGRKVTTITSVSIYAPDSTTDAVIYSDKGLQNTITIPMTSGSTNTTLSDGFFYWWGPDGYNFSMTDGSNIANNADHRPRNGSEGTLIFPSYLTAISSTTYSDAQTATFGSGGDWVLRGGNVANQMSFTPLADNSNFIIGVSGASLNSDFNVYVGTALGLEVDAGNPSFTWDGGAALLNHDSNFNVGINTGTSTGASTIGSSTSGTVTVDTTAGISVNADDSFALTVSAGTVSIAPTGGDLTLDATDKSVIIRGTEEVADAILLDADGTAGGIELQCGTGDITLDSGDDIFLEADTGTGDVISLINTQGTSAAAIVITTTAAGSIDVNSGDNVTIDTADDFDVTTADGGITLTAAGGSNGDVTLVSADDTIITSSGKVTITNTEAVTISGAMTVTGDTQLVSVTRIDTPIEIVTATNAIEITESGTVYVLNNGTEFATTLPTVASSAGVTYRFIVGVDPVGTAFTIVTDTLEDKIEGVVVVNGASVGADGPDDTITFTASAAVVGDWVELTSDGVLWYLSGHAVAATGIVPSKAD